MLSDERIKEIVMEHLAVGGRGAAMNAQYVTSESIMQAVRAAIAEAVAGEREDIAKSAEAAADAWRPYLRQFAAFVRARGKAKGSGEEG